eukprot:15334380-Ditylum_brightwellii.AAC.2
MIGNHCILWAVAHIKIEAATNEDQLQPTMDPIPPSSQCHPLNEVKGEEEETAQYEEMDEEEKD